MAWYEPYRITPPWWQSQGKIVASTRARFTRNIEGHKFPQGMDDKERESILNEITLSIKDVVSEFKNTVIDTNIKRDFFVERHVLSKDSQKNIALFTDHTEEESYLINDRDHLRFQITMPDNALFDVFSLARERLRTLEKEFNFSYSDTFGYLTSSLTNTGTGFRLSALMFIPGIFLARETEKILALLVKAPIVLRGLFGGHSEIKGNYLQISTKFTLSMGIEDDLRMLDEVVKALSETEEKSRNILLSEAHLELEDRISRSLAILESARIMSYDESLEHLSILKFASQLGFEGIPDEKTINRLIFWSSPSHIASLEDFELKDEEIDIKRADFIRKHLFRDYED